MLLQLNHNKNIYYALRIAGAMCFIGHGSFGIITKAVWCNYFAVFGIGHNMAYTMMPYVGSIDICFGLILLFYPLRIVAGWLVIWGLITALLRPLSGEPFAEFLERAGNYGAPLALLLFTAKNNSGFKEWLKPVQIPAQITKTWKQVTVCLQVVVFLLLLGHGWLNVIHKQALLDEYRSLGFTSPLHASAIIGICEIIAACVVLIHPVNSLLLVLFFWKVFSELFYPHYEVFEFIERGGSFGAILALWFALKQQHAYVSGYDLFSQYTYS